MLESRRLGVFIPDNSYYWIFNWIKPIRFFWVRTFITDNMEGHRGDLHTTHIRTTLSLIGVTIIENHLVVAAMTVRHFLHFDRSTPAQLVSDL
jgi:hypothetical protein